MSAGAGPHYVVVLGPLELEETQGRSPPVDPVSALGLARYLGVFRYFRPSWLRQRGNGVVGGMDPVGSDAVPNPDFSSPVVDWR